MLKSTFTWQNGKKLTNKNKLFTLEDKQLWPRNPLQQLSVNRVLTLHFSRKSNLGQTIWNLGRCIPYRDFYAAERQNM